MSPAIFDAPWVRHAFASDHEVQHLLTLGLKMLRLAAIFALALTATAAAQP